MNANKHTRQTGRNITIFVPGLLGLMEAVKHLPECDIPALKNLQRFLLRAKKSSVNVYDWHGGLASLFQLEKISAAELRHKQFSAADGKKVFYLCADPVYIQPDLNSAVLLAHEELALSIDEARELAASINTHFTEEDWSLDVLTPHRWLMKLAQPPVIKTMPLMKLVGQPIGNNLAQGKHGSYWQRIQNEIQMLLFAHPLTQRREEQGKLPVNSLWLWGEGDLPQTPTSGWDNVSGQGELLDALRGWCGCPGKTISINNKLVIDKSEQSLLASDEFILAVQNQDLYAWIAALEKFENYWMAVLLELLRAGEIDGIDLFIGEGIKFSLNRKMLGRRWGWTWLRGLVGSAHPTYFKTG